MSWLCCIKAHLPLDFSTIFLFIAVLVLGVLLKYAFGGPKNLPPFPAMPFPILGHLPYLRKGVREVMEKWTKEKGEIYSLYFGVNLTVMLNSYDIIKEAFVKQADAYSDRPVGMISKLRGLKESKGVVGASGKVWKAQRAISQTILRQFGMGKNYLALKIQEEISHYLSELAVSKGEPKDVRTLTSYSISNNICSIVIGKRFDYDDPAFTELIHLIDTFLRRVTSGSAMFGTTLMLYVPGDLFGIKKLAALEAQFRRAAAGVHIDRIKHSVDSSEETDNYILAYLREMKKQREDGHEDLNLDEVNLEYNVFSLFLAGTETTSTTIIWFMLYMLHFPEVQEKIYKEIVDVVGHERLPSMADKPQMNYLNAAIMETQRCSSILPLGVSHQTNEDTTLRGYFIPKGTRIMSHLDSVLRDEKTWKDPKTFNPENFLDKEGALHVPEQFIPFSIGRRVCLGEPLAKMEMFLYLSALLQRFELKPADPNNLPPLDAVLGIACPPEAFELRFIERNL